MAVRLMRGQPILLRGRDAPMAGQVYATCGGVLVAVGMSRRANLGPTACFI
jgi:tRNA pseudouridine55 synthase